MKEKLLSICINLIKKNNPYIKNTKIEEIKYGLEGIYLTLTKLGFILIASIALGIVKEFFFFLLFYNIIRVFAFGIHASKNSVCLVISLLVFLLCPYIALTLSIPMLIKIIISSFCILAIIFYAPADTHKRPLINSKKRLRLKFFSLFIAVFYVFLAFYINNSFLANILILALLVEVILILPTTYKLFHLPYNNYRNYNLTLNN